MPAFFGYQLIATRISSFYVILILEECNFRPASKGCLQLEPVRLGQ